MASIATLPLDFSSKEPWPEVVRMALAWSRDLKIVWRDAIVLVPFAQHLPLARRAWASGGTWLPRIETTQTLARSLGPAESPLGTQISFDPAIDRLIARRMLHAQGWAAAWARNDARAFDHAVGSVATIAHALARAGAAVPPDRRPAHWARGRALVSAQAAPGATERALARVAFEWAAASAAPATDALYLLRPSAWIVVQAGGRDALSMSLLSETPQGTPCLVVNSDPDIAAALGELGNDISVAVCSNFENEAQRTAAQVLIDLNAGAQPVALIAQDRLLTRRVRALLARQDVPLQDETGWKLSTTRAAAAIASLLRVARGDSSSDEWLDWLKTCIEDWPAFADATFALPALERALRRHGWSHPLSVDGSALEALPARLWQAAGDVVDRLRSRRMQSLSAWLGATGTALEACGAMTSLRHDDAGRQVLEALHMQALSGHSPGVGGDEPMTLEDFTAWVDGALEEGTYLPAAAPGAVVVVTPLERAMLRPFGAIVFAAADQKRLGAMPAPQPLIGDALALELGLPTATLRREAETLAFAQVLRAPKVALLRRVDDAGEALAPSPLLERLELARSQRGFAGLAPAADGGVGLDLAPMPIPRPLPTAGVLLPARLSASACEALRTCPYRFFALRLLKLRDADELDDELEKRDYGTWLHAVLYRFHVTRGVPLAFADEQARLHAVASEVQQAMRFDAAAFLPFAATFARFAPRYVEWLHACDAGGVQWLAGEVELVARPDAWEGVEMHGIVDRVDSVPGGDGPVTHLIDYKTGSAQRLREQMKSPAEDTQLAFYAALMAAQSSTGDTIGAAYLPLDESGALKPIEHPDVEATAQRLVDGIGAELARIRNGAPLPALGEGRACDYCEARGLCRRDHWPAGSVAG